MWIGPIGGIRLEPPANSCLAVSVMTYAQQVARVSSIGPMKLSIACPFASEEVPLREIDMITAPALAKVIDKSAFQPMDGFVVRLYQSSGISTLAEMKTRTCGYVSISQEIEGQPIYSTRVIRFEKSWGG
jgi:hypothetical protein